MGWVQLYAKSDGLKWVVSKFARLFYNVLTSIITIYGGNQLLIGAIFEGKLLLGWVLLYVKYVGLKEVDQ